MQLAVTNASEPYISRLPTEILTEIFLLCADEPVRGESRGYRVWWGSIMRVCRHWHDVAARSASLWTNIVFTPYQLTELMLQRSLSAPISIYYNFAFDYVTTAMDEDAVILALGHLPRARDIEIHGPMLLIHDLAKRMVKPAPELESLCLRNMKAGLGLGLKGVLPDLLGGVAPRLRRLSLSGTTIPLSSPILTRLTHLSLDGIPASASFSSEQLQTCLRVLALHLQELLICFDNGDLPVAAPLSEMGAGPTSLICMPELTVLTLHATVQFVSDLVDHLVIPFDARMKIVLSPPLISGPLVPGFMDPVSSADRTRLWHSVIVFFGSYGIELLAYTSADYKHAYVHCSAHPLQQANVLGNICGLLPFRDVYALRIEVSDVARRAQENTGHRKYTRAEWRSIFSAFTNVRKVELIDIPLGHFIGAVERSGGEASEVPLVLEMRELSVGRSDLRRNFNDGYWGRRLLLQELMVYTPFFRLRSKRGSPVESITFQDHRLSREEVRALR
ncbi:hypothetical protein EW146_g9206 [Bondarzewia mesenterica]|uniref:F-box domain-containing protein n=1 Tax=Bondarzewia mesenterica TaxID=1095465 RepID=A0A4S4L9N6_9AGAM|nr:hypothetical protein EW146_g9206 [Bondarzewia mesenterica]